MANLTYSAIASLDGYVADEDGNFDWAGPHSDRRRIATSSSRPGGGESAASSGRPSAASATAGRSASPTP